MRSKESDWKRWFLQGLQDLEDARFNLSGGRYNVACFLAQQSAGKVLKSFLLKSGAEEIWGHSVLELCRDAQSFDKEFETIEREAGSLDKYYIPTRYPDALPGGIPSTAFDDEDARRAVELADKIAEFVKKKL